MFSHLRVQSYYSFLRGVCSPASLVQAAVAHEMPALALTDHHSLTGAVEFCDACRAAAIHPILGLEVNLALPAEYAPFERGVLTLLAMDLNGWRSLCRLASILQGDEDALTPAQLAEENAGLICLSGGVRGSLGKLLDAGRLSLAERWVGMLAEIFPKRLYIELQAHQESDYPRLASLAALAVRADLPVAATHDIHYLTPEQAALQKVMTAIRRIQPIESLDPADTAPPDAFFLSPQAIAEHFSHYPAASAGTEEIVSRCRLELPLGVPHFPEVDLPPGMRAIDLLRQKALQGARQLYPAPPGSPDDLDPAARDRLEHELAVIDQCGYAALFLIVEEILNYARRQGIPFSSRGSAASSLVAHCLGITSPDPLRLNLYFERFLNPARATPPDIDTDLCSRRREEVIRFVYRRFGEQRVATVCTVNRFRSRSALREAAKAYGLPPDEVKALADSLPYRWYGPPQRFQPDQDPYAELAERYSTPLHRSIFRQAASLIDVPHHLSVHPGGVVISPAAMTDLVPTQMAAKGILITQFDLNAIERLGLVKIDLLGIRGLTVLGEVAQSPRFPTLLPARSANRLESIPEIDDAVSRTLEEGRTIGCFQIESPGMRATLRQIRARSLDDIMVALALYRPGPLTGGLKDAFVKRHLGLEPVAHLHPALSPLLEDTYGVILYQEQVLRIAHGLAGMSLAESDLLRRAMSHFDPGERMRTLRARFIAGAAERSGVPEEIAGRVWELMAAFAGYGFPKAHAASYAQIGWRSAWCKTHLPAEFMAAVLANWGGYYSQQIYLNEARRMGLAIRPPLVNHARREFSLVYLPDEAGTPKPALLMGLDQVRELTRRTQTAILQGQPFSSLYDFLARVDPRPVEVENLVKAGALSEFGAIPALLRQIEQGGWRGGQFSLFDPMIETGEDWPLEQKVRAQEAVLGIGIEAHPLELAQERIQAAGAITTLAAAERLGERVRLAGLRQTWRRSLTTRGDYIYFMALEDLEGMLDVVIFGEVYRRCRSALRDAGPYLLEGVVEFDEEKGEPFIRAERIEHL